ncbi:MAG: hypothetical protein IKD69_06940 [Solobacterium sp.]|nr:hypothetical protein [Solobacterium sp.]
MHRSRAGFVLSDFLAALCVVVLMVPLMTMCLGVLKGSLVFDERLQDEIALLQLRKILLISYDIEVSPQMLSFRYQARDMRLSLVNRRLIIQPGTQIFLSEIDGASFLEKDGMIEVIYSRGEQEYEKVLIPH